jgi:hypothetical protein
MGRRRSAPTEKSRQGRGGRTVCVWAPPSTGFAPPPPPPPPPGAYDSLGLGQGAGAGVGAEGGGQANEAEQVATQASSPPLTAAAGADSADAGGQYVSLGACPGMRRKAFVKTALSIVCMTVKAYRCPVGRRRRLGRPRRRRVRCLRGRR